MWELEESKDVVTTRHCHGLRLDIRHLLEFQNFDTIDEVEPHALKSIGDSQPSSSHHLQWSVNCPCHRIHVPHSNQAKILKQDFNLVVNQRRKRTHYMLPLTGKGSLVSPMPGTTPKGFYTCGRGTGAHPEVVCKYLYLLSCKQSSH